MLRQAPFTCAIAASTVKQFRSGILSLAISSTCFRVILPTLILFGSADPFARFTARFTSTATGGVFVMKVNERSEKMVITTGMISPSWSFAEVFALKALQNSMMFTPCGPSAVPTGGAGVALPAGICSFTCAVTFFAISSRLFLLLFYLQEIQLHRSGAAKNRNQYTQGVALRIDFVHFAREVR